MAAASRDAGRRLGDSPVEHYATARLSLEYRRPTPIDGRIELVARIERATDRGYVLSCSLSAAGKLTVEAAVEAVSVPPDWMGLTARGDRQ
jgi:hypothetical protein